MADGQDGYSYQTTLRKIFASLSQESKNLLSRISNPNLATGPMTLAVCKDGVVATIWNGFNSTDITSKVIIPDNLTQTMVEYFNAQADQIFTFMDPISKLSFKGNKAVFADAASWEGHLVNIIIEDGKEWNWLPPASKVFLMGWGFFDHGDVEAKAQEDAQKSVELAYGTANLHSSNATRKVLNEYRTLLNNAKHEVELQTFLETHPQLIYPEYELVLPKPSFGGERHPDFGFSMRSSFGARWIFVEIERPNTEFHLIYGRDTELDTSRRDMLIAEFSTTPNRMFNTFDDLANRFETIINRIFPSRTYSGVTEHGQ